MIAWRIADLLQQRQSHSQTELFLKEPKMLERLMLEQLRSFQALVSGEYSAADFENPTLRERRGNTRLLVNHFLRRNAGEWQN